MGETVADLYARAVQAGPRPARKAFADAVAAMLTPGKGGASVYDKRDDANTGEFQAREQTAPAESPLYIRVGNLEVEKAGEDFRVLVNGRRVSCKAVTIRGEAGRPWVVDLEFMPTDEQGRLIAPGLGPSRPKE